MKKIPLGISSFEKIARGDYYYFDKSQYIPVVENRSDFVMLARPRRMGKSMFSSMLASYYDINNRGRFDELFGSLWIGSNPTSEACKYLVLQFDFSKVKKDYDTLAQGFDEYVQQQVSDYFERYSQFYSQKDIDRILSHDSAIYLINGLILASRRRNLQTYLIIDEYDNFTNSVLAARGEKAHRAITHGMGFYRNFFQTFKDAFDRIYMTGVTPVTYDDLTSGFSIATLVALEPWFNQIVGVTETELRDMIEYYRQEGLIHRETDTIIAEMKPWYDNFCFAQDCYGKEAPIYNTNMVLTYMSQILIEDKQPRIMIDRGARTDTNKLDYLILTEELGDRQRRIDIIEEICSKGYIIGSVIDQFSAIDAGLEENFKSILYYYGTLTYGGWNEYNETILKVPNKTMADLYLNYMLRIAQEQGFKIGDCARDINAAIKTAALEGDWAPMIDEIGKAYKNYSSIRNSIRGEADMQGFIRGLLTLNRYYAVWPELELGGGFCDILLAPRAESECPARHSYLIELKYIKKSGETVEHAVSEASAQLRQYLTDTRLSETDLLRETNLTPLCLVFQDLELVHKGIIPIEPPK